MRSRPRERRSVQPEFAVDRPQLGRLDQPGVRHGDRMQNALERALPESQEALQLREIRAQVVLLPDVGLQQPRIVRPAIQDASGGQAIAAQLTLKVLRGHRRISFPKGMIPPSQAYYKPAHRKKF